MSKKIFPEKEIKILIKNKNISKISAKAIIYSLEFKKKFIEEYLKAKFPRKIFEESEFDI